MQDPIFDIFREETREHLKLLEQGFLDLETISDPSERAQLVSKLFRHAHNIKGDARALGIVELQKSSAVLEEILERLRHDPAAINSAIIQESLSALDVVLRVYENWQQRFGQAEDTTETPPQASFDVETTADFEARAEDAAIPQTKNVSTMAGKGSDFTAGSQVWMEEAFSVRVPAEKLDRMLNLVGEVRVLQRSDAEIQRQLKDLRSRLERLHDQPERDLRSSMEAAFDHVRRIETTLHQQQTREQVLMQSLEADISAVRLLPLTMLADSLRRPLRDLARSLGKEIRYEVDVGNVMLDKAVIESLRTPLLHLLRNAVDHGIETPQQRQSLGKPIQGIVRLAAQRRGEKVHIELSDDGAGPDFERIKERIRARRELQDDELEQLTETELSQWLFQPGFSTAEIGEISGRGVGLDVVRDALQRIQGRIDLKSRSGQGTTFSLILPITISTIRILTVWCHGQCFGLPSETVLKTGRINRSEVRRLKGVPVVSPGGESIRWLALSDLLQLDQVPEEVEPISHSYVVVEQDGRRVAIQVDEVDEEREVLLKPLGFPLKGMSGVLGGTIRPDASVQLVLDLTADLFQRASTRPSADAGSSSSRVPLILVVDDSPTTRALLKSVFNAEGYAVRTAVDGLDAMEKLRISRPDLVVCDFEMPRLNGVDLTRQIKSKWKLPVILVTGREQEHHRLEGLEAGADAYLVKSTFRGEGLLEVVRQFLKE